MSSTFRYGWVRPKVTSWRGKYDFVISMAMRGRLGLEMGLQVRPNANDAKTTETDVKITKPIPISNVTVLRSSFTWGLPNALEGQKTTEMDAEIQKIDTHTIGTASLSPFIWRS